MADAPFQELRDRLGAKIAALDVERATDYAQFIRTGDPGGPVPCWGAIAKRFEDDFPTDDDRLALMRAVFEQPDKRVLALFLYRNRGRKGVMAALVRNLDRLPPHLQAAAAAIVPPAAVPAEVWDKLEPAARALLDADDATRAREAEQLEVRAKKLLAFDYFVPDAWAPGVEPTSTPSGMAEPA